jgi:hypothetical protein
MRTLRQLTVFLFLLLLLTAPWQASAAGARASRQSPPNVESLSTALVSWAWEALARLWNKNGCGIDPDGRCALEPAPSIHAKNGCRIDPDGRCLVTPDPLARPENGCTADPNGRCGS